MSKGPQNIKNAVNISRFCDSTFSISFIVEILGMDVWHDFNEGWADLGTCTHGLKLQYQLYPGQSFDVDILIWPHVAKIWCGNLNGFVRTWQMLERRWLAFTIRHVFPVRVMDMINHEATIVPCVGLGALGANAKNDKNVEAYIPALWFGESRYFGQVIDKVESLENFIHCIIWSYIEDHIPASYLDGIFNMPQCVTDIRHQNAVLKVVRETILNRVQWIQKEELEEESEQTIKAGDGKQLKNVKDRERKKVVEAPRQKYELKLSGNKILAGAGQIIKFENSDEPAQDVGEIIALISSNNLPAQDDCPILFVIIRNLTDLPRDAMKKLRITEVFTKWKLGTEEHSSQKQNIRNNKNIDFNDYHTVVLPLDNGSRTVSSFLDNPFEIQLYGQRNGGNTKNPRLFGSHKSDYDLDMKYSFGTSIQEENMLIAVTKIDACEIAKGTNRVIKQEYSLYPCHITAKNIDRNDICTNDMNAINRIIKSDNTVQPSVILTAQMSLEVTVGLVGCQTRFSGTPYSRIYCLTRDSNVMTGLTEKVLQINDDFFSFSHEDNVLTGFTVYAGHIAFAFVEGPWEGLIMKVWKFTEMYSSKMKLLYSNLDKYPNRIYPEMLLTAMPYNILKMNAPLNSLLACPAVYVKPALPVPAKTALLKIGRIVSSNLKIFPNRDDMPTMQELSSFQLELCAPEKPDWVRSYERQ